MSEEISDYDLLIQEPENAVTPPADTQSAAVEEQPEKQDELAGIDGIATPDGKRIIPFDRLKSEIDARVEAESKYQELVNQIEAFKNGQSVANSVVPQEALDKLAELEEYDTEAAEVLRKTLQDMSAAAQRAAQIEREQVAKQQQQQAQEQAQQQAIIESYPALKEMQQNPEAWAQAGKVYESFYENPVTAQLSEADKIAKLNDVMTALLGVKAQPQQQIAVASKTQPFSLSDLGSGVIPPASSGSKDPLEMSASELQAYWAKVDYDDFGKAF